MSSITYHKPQAAIDAGLLDRNEAAHYLGKTPASFNLIAKYITSIRLGHFKYYDPQDLRQYLANIQRLSRKSLQLTDN